MQFWNVLRVARWKVKIHDAKIAQKFVIWSPSHNFVGLCLCNCGTYRQSEKLVRQQYLPYMSPQYGELWPTSGWDPFVSVGTPGNFNGVRILAALLHGTIVVGVSQTAAFNRGRHLYSAGRPSRWALAHISSWRFFAFCIFSEPRAARFRPAF